MGLIKFLGIAIIVCCVLSIIMGWVGYFQEMAQPPNKVKCYDRYENEIIGLECLNTNNNLSTALLLTVLGSIGIAGGVMATSADEVY